jgi:hypothetical protein
VAAGALGLQRRREAGLGSRRWWVWPAYGLSATVAVSALLLSASIARSQVGEQIAQRTAAVYHGLPAAQRDQTVLVGESYIIAAYFDGYSFRYALPEAYSTNRSYGYFRPPPAGHDTVLYIGTELDALRPYFRDARAVGDIGEDLRAYLLTGLRQPWHAIWPRLRTLTVS